MLKLKPNSTYYASLYDNSKVDGYTFKITEYKDDSGDYFESSREISLNKKLEYKLHCTADEDIFKFTTNSDNSFIINIKAWDTLSTRVDLYDANGNLIDYSINDRTRINGIYSDVIKPNSTYYLKISYGKLYVEQDLDYDLIISSGFTKDIANEKIEPATGAYLAPTKVKLDGKVIPMEVYNIRGSKYVSLRDLALALKGTKKQFGINWDNSKKAINLVSNKPYVPVGGEMTKKNTYKQPAALNISNMYKDDKIFPVVAYTVNGGNYIKPEDIGQAFDFSVIWDRNTDTIVIDTKKGYQE
jgi:hypothetical protein